MGVDKKDLINALNTQPALVPNGYCRRNDMENMMILNRQEDGFDMGGRKRFFRSAAPPLPKPPSAATQSYSLRLAQEGERVRIVSITGGKGVHERLAGFGLRVGAEVQVLQNSMNGKLLLDHQGARLYLGGGMAHKIRVIDVQGGNR